MHISLFTIIMTIIWSSLLTCILYFLRTRLLLLDVCSITGVIVVYMFCALRLLLPIETPWTKVVKGGVVWNFMQKYTSYELFFLHELSINIGSVLIGVWIVGALYNIIKIIITYRKLKKYVYGISKEKLVSEFFLINGISVYKSKQVMTPCAVGIVKKVILLPEREYSRKKLEYILLHEMTHHQNRDILIKIFINIICAIYWWNPFIYFLKKDINHSLEIRCDQRATNNFKREEKAEYLSIILEEFKNSLMKPRNKYEYVMEILGDENHELVERFQFVANAKYNNSMWKNFVIIAVALILFMASYSFVIQSSIDVPDEMMEEGSYYFDSSNSYIIELKNGNYILVTPWDFMQIDEEEADFYRVEGFDFREEKE